jgi:1,4-alpha-glucan branching enzyme
MTSATGELILSHPGASRVQLVSDWNNWGGMEGPIERVDSEIGRMTVSEYGNWVLAIPANLPRGRYRYAFLVDGHRLIPDPMNPERATWNGHEVSVLVVR